MTDTTKRRPHILRSVLIALTIHVMIGACSEAAVVANFTFSPPNPVAGQPVQFTDTSAGNPTWWQWDFQNPPNGTDSTLQNPTWTFDAPGTYPVRLVVAIPPIDIDEVVINVAVSPACDPGEVSFTKSTYDAGIDPITVQRTGGSCGAVSAQFYTADGTATAGIHYTATMKTLFWADGDTAYKTCTVPILDDDFVEGDETVSLSLTNETGGATLGAPSAAILTIFDDIFANRFESGDTCLWSKTVSGSNACNLLSPAEVIIRVLRASAIDCVPVQLAPAVETSGSIRLKLPANDMFHLHLSEEGTVVLDREASARAGEVIEIVGLGLVAPYELDITAEKRPLIHFSIELTAATPCAAIEFNP